MTWQRPTTLSHHTWLPIGLMLTLPDSCHDSVSNMKFSALSLLLLHCFWAECLAHTRCSASGLGKSRCVHAWYHRNNLLGISSVVARGIVQYLMLERLGAVCWCFQSFFKSLNKRFNCSIGSRMVWSCSHTTDSILLQELTFSWTELWSIVRDRLFWQTISGETFPQHNCGLLSCGTGNFMNFQIFRVCISHHKINR